MKVEVRKYEHLFIASLGLMAIVGYILQRLNLVSIYTAGFEQYNIAHPDGHFNYKSVLLMPRIFVVVLLSIVYFWFNCYTLPRFIRGNRRSVFSYFLVIFQLIILSLLLAIGVNAATYYARPALNNYGEFFLFTFFGYNENPLNDLWAGVDQAFIFVFLYTIYAAIREYIIYRIENSGTKRDYLTLIINQLAACICILILLPKLALASHIINDETFFNIYFVFVFSLIGNYFTNTYWLFPRFFDSPGIPFSYIWRLVLLTFLLNVPFALIINRFAISPFTLLLNWFIQLAVVTPFIWIVYNQRKDKITQLRGAEKALSKSRADLQFLRSQINPHFLFNVLNTIYATALVDGSRRTAEAVQMLGDMMRFMLDDNHLDFIPLNNEISYLRNYIALQRLRIQESDEITITENFVLNNCVHEIVPMLLIPFVENAFKHGLDLQKKSWIDISLSCNDTHIALNVVNSLHAADLNDPERKQSGIGLKNIRERLAIFYPGSHLLKCQETDQEFIAELIIEFKTTLA